MNIAQMNQRITIQQNIVLSDAIGNRKNEWRDYYACHASISGEAGKEQTEAGLVVDNSKLEFTVRWCAATKALDCTHYRVQFGDELYNIQAVDHMKYRSKFIKLCCEKVSR